MVSHITLQVSHGPRRSHSASFGLVVNPEFGNCGVASRLMSEIIAMCDNWLRVDRIELTVFVDNAPAIQLYQKLGFEIEGTAKRYGLRDGEYIDAYFMARSKAG